MSADYPAGNGTAIDPDLFDFKLYRYRPSLPAAIISVVVFAALTIAHTWRLHRARAYYFIAFTIGGLCKSLLYTLSPLLMVMVL